MCVNPLELKLLHTEPAQKPRECWQRQLKPLLALCFHTVSTPMLRVFKRLQTELLLLLSLLWQPLVLQHQHSKFLKLLLLRKMTTMPTDVTPVVTPQLARCSCWPPRLLQLLLLSDGTYTEAAMIFSHSMVQLPILWGKAAACWLSVSLHARCTACAQACANQLLYGAVYCLLKSLACNSVPSAVYSGNRSFRSAFCILAIGRNLRIHRDAFPHHQAPKTWHHSHSLPRTTTFNYNSAADIGGCNSM